MPNKFTVFIVVAVLMISGWSAAKAEPPRTRNSAVIVYYFHRTIRCPSCTLLEELTREAVASEFEKELKNGRVRLAVINVDENENEHFVSQYSLNVQSVIVSEIDNGREKRWKNLDQVWTLIENEAKLMAYIQEEIKGYLNK